VKELAKKETTMAHEKGGKGEAYAGEKKKVCLSWEKKMEGTSEGGGVPCLREKKKGERTVIAKKKQHRRSMKKESNEGGKERTPWEKLQKRGRSKIPHKKECFWGDLKSRQAPPEM